MADVFVRPETCKLIATVQTDICEVDNLYSCPSTNGVIGRGESFDSTGLTSVSINDPTTGLSSLDDVWGDGSSRLQMSGDKDGDIVRKGFGSSSAVGEAKMFGLWRPVSGTETAEYSGETVELAGKTFLRIEVIVIAHLPYPIPSFTGREVRAYNEELDLTVTLEVTHDSNILSGSNSRLAQLSLPGQPGFGDEQPRYGCMTLGAVSRASDREVPA
ncbi:MAG: hypothetical protein HC783_04915 [Rhodobacteraceae bacterium]|nr:hypothetical protein [Paracoccaceae bacterium]